MAENENSPLQYQQNQRQASQAAALSQSDSACQCPNCGNAVNITADICEQCGHWLKEGQCCFCYAEVKAGQKFCRECGNPPAGKPCPNCNTFSRFDFCPSCNTPISKRSMPYLEAFRQSPAFLELVQLSMATDSITPAPIINEQTAYQLDQLKTYLDQFEKTTNKKQEPGFTFSNQNVDATDALKKASQQENLSQKKDTTAADLELIKKIALLQQQTFTDNQSARMFYTAIKVLLPELIKTQQKRIIGWLCNWAGVIHAAPHECSQPNLGGEWQYESFTTYETTYSEH